jgi:hypothetical protein
LSFHPSYLEYTTHYSTLTTEIVGNGTDSRRDITGNDLGLDTSSGTKPERATAPA